MPLQIGVTGGIGSGKSLICKIFQCLGVPVYDADRRAKYVMTTNGILIEDIKKEFGELSFHADGSLNNKYLADAVFNNPDRLSMLNSLVHPRVAEDYTQWVNDHRYQPYVVKEAALLFESGSYRALDEVILVYAPEEMRIRRVQHRDKGRSAAQIRDIMDRQMPDEEKLKMTNTVIRNDETEMVIPQVLQLHEKYKKGTYDQEQN